MNEMNMSKVRSRSINIILKINLKIRSLFKGTSFPNHNLVNIFVRPNYQSPEERDKAVLQRRPRCPDCSSRVPGSQGAAG